MSESSYGSPTDEQLAETARSWVAKGEEHIRAAQFCHEQASRFLARISVEETVERPQLTLIQGGMA